MPADRRWQRDHDPQLDLPQCATATAPRRRPPRSACQLVRLGRHEERPDREQLLLRLRQPLHDPGQRLRQLRPAYNSIAGQIVIFDREGGGSGMDFVGNNMGYTAGGCTADNSGVPINWRYNVMSGGTCGRTDRTRQRVHRQQQQPPPLRRRRRQRRRRPEHLPRHRHRRAGALPRHAARCRGGRGRLGRPQYLGLPLRLAELLDKVVAQLVSEPRHAAERNRSRGVAGQLGLE